MKMFSRTMLAAGLLFSLVEARAHAADMAPSSPVPEPIAAPASDEFVSSAAEIAACANGKCKPGKTGAHGHDKEGSCYSALKRWACYTPSRQPCDCGWQTSLYRPPLYTWFLCHPGTCVRTNPCAAPTCAPAGYIVARKVEEPLPKPEMPKFVGKEKPLVPGSAAVAADNKDAVPVTPANYKGLPIHR